MTNQNATTSFMILGLTLGLLQGCGAPGDLNPAGSGSGGDAPAIDPVSPADPVVLPASAHLLQDLPSLNPEPYDYDLATPVPVVTSGSELSFMSTQSLMARPGVGLFSRAACESDSLKNLLFSSAWQADTFLCYVKEVEQSDPALEVPTDGWGYFDVTLPVIEGGPTPDLRVRIGEFANELRMDVCSRIDGVYVRDFELSLTSDIDSLAGYIIQAGNARGVLSTSRFDVELLELVGGIAGKAQFGVREYGRDAAGSYDNKGGVEFGADAATQTNDLSGNFELHIPGFMDLGVSSVMRDGDGRIGSVKYDTAVERTPPTEAQCRAWGVADSLLSSCVGKCYYNGEGMVEVPPNADGKCEFRVAETQSFELDPNPETGPKFTILENELSPYYAEVDSTVLPSLLTEIENRTAFVRNWDCGSATGFTKIDATGLTTELTACGSTEYLSFFQTCEEEIWNQWEHNSD